jgi:hypothetical protein
MREQDWMNHVKKPTIIIQAILRGPLTGDMVEFFLKNRDEKFRAEAKRLILHAEDMTRDPILFETSVREWAHTTVDQVPTFEQFCSNLNDLMRDLRKGMETKFRIFVSIFRQIQIRFRTNTNETTYWNEIKFRVFVSIYKFKPVSGRRLEIK